MLLKAELLTEDTLVGLNVRGGAQVKGWQRGGRRQVERH